jgi:DNA polymerase lambda
VGDEVRVIIGTLQNPARSDEGTRREESPMAPKRKPARAAAAVERDPDGIFRGVSAFFIPHGVQSRRLEVRDLSQAPPVHPRRRREFVLCAIVLKHLGSAQVWKQRLVQMGGHVQQKIDKGAPTVNHVLAMDAKALLRDSNAAWLHRFRGVTAAHLLPSN